MTDIHHHYNQLTAKEREAVDTCFNRQMGAIWFILDTHGIPAIGDDRCERAVDAIARWIIESRPKT